MTVPALVQPHCRQVLPPCPFINSHCPRDQCRQLAHLSFLHVCLIKWHVSTSANYAEVVGRQRTSCVLFREPSNQKAAVPARAASALASLARAVPRSVEHSELRQQPPQAHQFVSPQPVLLTAQQRHQQQ